MKSTRRRIVALILVIVMLLSFPSLQVSASGPPALTEPGQSGWYLDLITGVPNHMERILLTEYISPGLYPVTLTPSLPHMLDI